MDTKKKYGNYGTYGSSTGKKVDSKAIEADFKKYADPSTNKISPAGMEKMGETLGIDIYSDLFIAYFFYKCNIQNMEVVTLEEYIKGLTAFGVSNLNDIKPQIITIKGELLNIHTDDFKKFYLFLFNINMDKKQKSLSYEAVELFFNELFGPQFGIVKQFLDFLQNQKKSYSLKFDQWSCFLDLMKTIGDGFPNGYSTEDSWPTLFDEFYEWYCSKTGIPFEKKYKTDE